MSARYISDLLSEQDRIPVGEAIELPPDDGWAQWDLATTLLDKQAPSQAGFCSPSHQLSV